VLPPSPSSVGQDWSQHRTLKVALSEPLVDIRKKVDVLGGNKRHFIKFSFLATAPGAIQRLQHAAFATRFLLFFSIGDGAFQSLEPSDESDKLEERLVHVHP